MEKHNNQFRGPKKKVRLIDANALLEKLSRMIDYCKDDSKVNGLTALFQVGDAIIDCPTVDAVEVVRCKDCKRYSQSGLCNLYLNVSHEMKPDDFCSYGERRTDNG